MNAVSRKTATYLNLGFQYLMMGAMIVRGIIIPPLAVYYIDHNLLGAWLASGNIMQWLMVSEGGAWLYLRQRVAQEFGKGDNKTLAIAIGSGGVLLLFLGTGITILSLSLAPMIPGWMHVDEKFSAELILAFSLTAIGMGLGLLASIPRAVGHGLQQQIAVNINLLISEIVSLAAIIWLLIDGYGVVALGVSPLIREVIHNLLNWPTFIIAMRSLSIRPTISILYLKNMSANMAWTFISNLSHVMRNNVDAIIVSQVFGNTSVLVVEWTKRAWELLSSFVLRASGSFTPALAHLHGERDVPKFHTIISRLFSVIAIATGITFAFGLAFNEIFVGLWVGANFYAGTDFNLLLGLATITYIVSFTLFEVLFATGHIRGPAIAKLIQSIARIALLFALIPKMGILSLPLSLLVTEILGGLIYLSLQWMWVLKVPGEKILGQFLLITRALIVAVILVFIWALLPPAENWLLLVTHGVLFGAATLLAFYLVEPFVRQIINGVLISLWRRK